VNTPIVSDTHERPLDILGIGEAEERAYRWLLAHPGATVQALATALALTPRKAQRLLDGIEDKGLVTHSPEKPRRYNPSAPDIAMEALALQRQDMLKRARGTIRELQQEANAQQRSELEPMVELITNREAERQIFEHMQQTARREVVTLLRPPMRISQLSVPADQDQQVQRQAQARGVRFRTIADQEFLALSGAVARIRHDVKSREEVRIFPRLPFKMVLADKRIAVIPLRLDGEISPSLLVRSSALLDALYSLFEMLWARSAPMAFIGEETSEPEELALELHQSMRELTALMAAGLNDKRIASELDISVRTLRRRTAELMQELDARTRFQAGWLAALRLSGSTPFGPKQDACPQEATSHIGQKKH
jgi:sugar-specific transcriptional regulator TrmB/DNA-binding CsgD family transcriptional regulator